MNNGEKSVKRIMIAATTYSAFKEIGLPSNTLPAYSSAGGIVRLNNTAYAARAKRESSSVSHIATHHPGIKPVAAQRTTNCNRVPMVVSKLNSDNTINTKKSNNVCDLRMSRAMRCQCFIGAVIIKDFLWLSRQNSSCTL